jgi:hypothetical protein
LLKNRKFYIENIEDGWGEGRYKPYGKPELKKWCLRVKTREVVTLDRAAIFIYPKIHTRDELSPVW